LVISSWGTTFYLYSYDAHRDPLSFPTRRSSDLSCCRRMREKPPPWRSHRVYRTCRAERCRKSFSCVPRPLLRKRAGTQENDFRRSEEHTSELQSRSELVCRILLEKNKHRTVRGP